MKIAVFSMRTPVYLMPVLITGLKTVPTKYFTCAQTRLQGSLTTTVLQKAVEKMRSALGRDRKIELPFAELKMSLSDIREE